MKSSELKNEIEKESTKWAVVGLETNYIKNLAGVTLDEALSGFRDKNSVYTFKHFASTNYGFCRTLDVVKTHKRSKELLAMFRVEVNFMNRYGEVTVTPTVTILV